MLADRLRAPKQLEFANSSAHEKDYDSALGFLDTLRPRENMPDSRGFAWYYLHRLVSPRVRTLPALPQRVRAVAHAHDGRTIALADEANYTFLMDSNTGTLRELPASHRLSFCKRLVFSPDDCTLASLSHGPHGIDWPYSEVKVWDTRSGAELGGMTDNFGYCYQLLFSPDGERLITVEAVSGGSPAPVRSWSLSDDRKRIALSESLRAQELKSRLSPARRIADSAPGPIQLSDVLAVTPEDDSTTAVSLETGEIWLYTTKAGYCKAVCRLQGPEVVFIPRTDLAVPYTQAQVDEIGLVACTLTGSARARPIRQDATVLWAQFSRDGRTAAVQEPYAGHRDGKLAAHRCELGSSFGRVSMGQPVAALHVRLRSHARCPLGRRPRHPGAALGFQSRACARHSQCAQEGSMGAGFFRPTRERSCRQVTIIRSNYGRSPQASELQTLKGHATLVTAAEVFAGPAVTGFRRLGQNGPPLERRHRRPAHCTSGSHQSCFCGRIFA